MAGSSAAGCVSTEPAGWAMYAGGIPTRTVRGAVADAAAARKRELRAMQARSAHSLLPRRAGGVRVRRTRPCCNGHGSGRISTQVDCIEDGLKDAVQTGLEFTQYARRSNPATIAVPRRAENSSPTARTSSPFCSSRPANRYVSPGSVSLSALPHSPSTSIFRLIGLLTPGKLVPLRYIFSPRWNFERWNATIGNRAGIDYRREK